jgi:hypothetical protein
MAINLLTKVEAEGNSFIVLTKTRHLAFFSMPRTSVMPYEATKFASTPGFQVRYNTSNPAILEEWHNMITSMIGRGLFEALSEGTRVGFFPYPEDKRHLEQYIKGFM